MENNKLIRILFLHNKLELENIVKNKNAQFWNISKNSENIKKINEGDKKFIYIDQQLIDYLDGNLKQFNISYTLKVSPFTTNVLKETSKIPFGEVRTYKEIAINIGTPKAYRAVGNSLASNPIPIIIPCHRVIKSNGEIGGFGGSPELKIKLLLHEKAIK